MQAAEARVVGRGRNQVVVAVGDTNGDGEQLYVRLGYARTGRGGTHHITATVGDSASQAASATSS